MSKTVPIRRWLFCKTYPLFKGRLFRILFKTLLSIILFAFFCIFATSVSLIYDFGESKPFSGPDIFNPYAKVDTAVGWKRANFHTHTKVEGIFNECYHWPAEVEQAYKKFGYDIVTFSNHNELTEYSSDNMLKVNVYEHGYNFLKYHKLVFGCSKVNYFDHLLPFLASQRQFQIDLLGKDADFIVLNHPLRTPGSSINVMQKLGGYRIIELDSGKSTENEYWDWALTAGHYSFGLANDDLHFPDRTRCIAVRSNFVNCSSGRYEDIKDALLSGGYYSMRVPDFGHGDWNEKYARNKQLASIVEIGLNTDTIFLSLSALADSIKVIGQNHKTLRRILNSDTAIYVMPESEPYARITAYFPTGEVIYTNPFARYDASVSDSPFTTAYSVDILLTVLYNLTILVLCIAVIIALKKCISL